MPKIINITDDFQLVKVATQKIGNHYGVYNVKENSFTSGYTDLIDISNLIVDKVSNENIDLSNCYFDRNSKIPRSKFREYGLNKGWKISRKIDEATAYVIPNDYFFPKYHGSQIYNYITILASELENMFDVTSKLYNEVKQYKLFSNYFYKNHTYNSIIKTIEYDCPNFNISDYHYVSFLLYSDSSTGYNERNAINSEIYLFEENNKCLISRGPIYSLSNDTISTILNYRKKLISDAVISKHIGETVLTRESYQSIALMVETGSLDNINVVLGIITQCNFEQSALYLAMFIYKYNNIIYNFPAYRHKNYKSLLNYFNKYGDAKHWRINTLLTIVKEKKELLTDEFQDLLDQEVRDFINNRVCNITDIVSINKLDYNYD